MFCEIANRTLCKVGEVERYWTGGRVKKCSKVHCGINTSLFYAVEVRYRITMPTCLMRCMAKIFFFILLLDSL